MFMSTHEFVILFDIKTPCKEKKNSSLWVQRDYRTPYGVVCIVGEPAPSHIIIGGADDKLKRKPSLDPSWPVVFSLFLAHVCYSPDKLLTCITTYTQHNEYKTRMLSSIHIVPDRILECTCTWQLNMYINKKYIYYIGTRRVIKIVCWL